MVEYDSHLQLTILAVCLYVFLDESYLLACPDDVFVQQSHETVRGQRFEDIRGHVCEH